MNTRLKTLPALSCLAVLASLTGCVTVKEHATVGDISIPVWKSNAGENNRVDQVTDAQASVPLVP